MGFYDLQVQTMSGFPRATNLLSVPTNPVVLSAAKNPSLRSGQALQAARLRWSSEDPSLRSPMTGIGERIIPRSSRPGQHQSKLLIWPKRRKTGLFSKKSIDSDPCKHRLPSGTINRLP